MISGHQIPRILLRQLSTEVCILFVVATVILIVSALCLSGMIEVNPGPAFSLCTLNIRSLNYDHFLVLSDIIRDIHVRSLLYLKHGLPPVTLQQN